MTSMKVTSYTGQTDEINTHGVDYRKQNIHKKEHMGLAIRASGVGARSIPASGYMHWTHTHGIATAPRGRV